HPYIHPQQQSTHSILLFMPLSLYFTAALWLRIKREMHVFLRSIIFAALCLVLTGQEVTPELFNGLSWRLIGPYRGGRSVAVTGVPGDGSTFYFGAVNGGIWKT